MLDNGMALADVVSTTKVMGMALATAYTKFPGALESGLR